MPTAWTARGETQRTQTLTLTPRYSTTPPAKITSLQSLYPQSRPNATGSPHQSAARGTPTHETQTPGGATHKRDTAHQDAHSHTCVQRTPDSRPGSQLTGEGTTISARHHKWCSPIRTPPQRAGRPPSPRPQTHGRTKAPRPTTRTRTPEESTVSLGHETTRTRKPQRRPPKGASVSSSK